MFTIKLKQFLLLTLLFFAIFIIVIPIVYLFIIETQQPGEVAAGIFCVKDNSQIFQGILSRPDHFLNIWFMYFTAAAYCGTPFYYGATVIDLVLFLLQTVAIPLLVSMLMAFLYTKAFRTQFPLKDTGKQKLYLTFFLAVIIFLIIRYVKNGFSNPLLLEYGGDPIIGYAQHYPYPVAVLQAFLYGPTGIMDRTDPQVYLGALFTSVILDALVSLIGGSIVAILVQKLFVKKPGKKHKLQ